MRARNNRLLITGTNEQLGRRLSVVSEKYPNYDFHIKTSKQLDITRKKQTDILFAKEKFDFCINFEAYTAVNKVEFFNRENAFLVSVKAVKNLAKAIMEIISAKTTNFGFYPYTNEGTTRRYVVAKTIYEIKGIKIKVNPISSYNYAA